MKIKVSETTKLQLNWLVTKVEGALMPVGNVMLIGTQLYITVGGDWAAYGKVEYTPSTDWAQGGPIIEREFISINELACGLITADHPTWHRGDVWMASKGVPDADELEYCGPTPLIAAMRCYVASELGDEVEVPEELA